MAILVTGGAGFIGFHLTKKLLEQGKEVIVVDNLNEYYDVNLKKQRLKLINKARFNKVDISDKEKLEQVFKDNKINKICHLAAQAGVRYSLENPFVYADSNYVGTLNVFELAKRYKIKDIVFASTSSVYGLNKKMPFTEDQRVNTPISIYSASKRACELLAYSYCHLFKLNISCMRFFTVYGPYGRPDMALFLFTKGILDNKPIEVFNNGKMKRDFTYVDDIVNGFILALDKLDGFNIFNLGAGSPVKLMDFIELIEKELGKIAKKKMMPMQPGDVEATWADISKAKKILGYKPNVDIKQGVKNFISWYLSSLKH